MKLLLLCSIVSLTTSYLPAFIPSPRHTHHAMMTSSPSLTNSPSTPTSIHGAFTVSNNNAELPDFSAYDVLTVFYTPPHSFFPDEAPLNYCGGFNGFDGSDEPLSIPFTKTSNEELGGQYKCSIVVPNFAWSIQFCVTDGVRYDTGPANSYFTIHITHIQVSGSNGAVKLMNHDPVTQEKTLVSTVENVDPLELEKKLRARQEGVQVDVGETETTNPYSTVLSVREGSEAVVRGFIAEADVVGRALGMGNMEIGEARQAFDAFDVEGTGGNLVSVELLPKALAEAGFYVEVADVVALIEAFVEDVERGGVKMGEFVRMYHYLDQEEMGIEMV